MGIDDLAFLRQENENIVGRCVITTVINPLDDGRKQEVYTSKFLFF